MTADRTELPATQRDVLATVADEYEEHPPRSTEIAEASRIETAHIYTVLAELDTKGYIDRRAAPADKRVTHIRLTDKGQAVLETLEAQYTIEIPPTVPAETREEWVSELAETVAGVLAANGPTPPATVGQILDTPVDHIAIAVDVRSEWFEDTDETLALTDAGREVTDREVTPQ